MPKAVFNLKFDAAALRKDAVPARYDALAFRRNEQAILAHLDVRSLLPGIGVNRYDSFRVGSIPYLMNGRFNAASKQSGLIRNRLEIFRIDKTRSFCSCLFDARALQCFDLRNRWDSGVDYPIGVGRFTFTYDSRWAYRSKTANRFQIFCDYIARICYCRSPARFYSIKPANDTLPVRFDAALPILTACYCNRFDTNGRRLYLHPARKQAFVRPGWRIVAKNISTGEFLDLGFIDAESENRALEGIFLPDGDYEVSVLTSSLFWKDASDFETRLLSIRPGEEVTPLPTIYNLRSSVSQGETTIYWSAGYSDLEDCVFGVWYSPTSPVPTDGPPSATVWYFSEMTEYQTSFKQSAPSYAAIAAMKPGNDPEVGKIHELFLDWKSTLPRPPDDVIVIDTGREPEND